MEMLALIWPVLYYFGWFVGLYVFFAVMFVVLARLEKDEDGQLIIDPDSLHYRACKKCYRWRMSSCSYKDRVDYIEFHQMGICGYVWRVFWAPLFLLIGYTIFGAGQTVKTVVYAPFMFLFGYYPWPTKEVMKREENPLAVEVKRISFPRIGKLELKPYLVVLPVLYGWLFLSYPQTTWNWTLIAFVVVLVMIMVSAAFWAKDKIGKSENPRVMLAREYIKTSKRSICPLLKVKTKSVNHKRS